MPLLKPLIVACFILWHFSVTIVLANSGSYIAGKFAEKEGDFKNASYYYIDLISRGDSEREIITRSIIYAALAGNFEIAKLQNRKYLNPDDPEPGILKFGTRNNETTIPKPKFWQGVGGMWRRPL